MAPLFICKKLNRFFTIECVYITILVGKLLIGGYYDRN